MNMIHKFTYDHETGTGKHSQNVNYYNILIYVYKI